VKVPVLESIFLNRSPVPQTRDFCRVLVLGGDESARELGERLKREGHEVLILGGKDRSEVSDGIALPPDTVLERVNGFVGGFEALLRSPLGHSTERVGFIVAAQPGENIPKYSDYGLARSERVMSLSDVEDMLIAGEAPAQPRGEWIHVVFLCGLEGESDPLEFERVFDAIERLRKICLVQPHVFTRHVKVAAPGLERRYRQTREEGTLFFKFDGIGPVFEEGPEGLTMIFHDPVLGFDMEIVPDLLVVDERHLPPASLKPLLDAIPSAAATTPFLQPESTRFSGVRTLKAGILALGPSRGNFCAQGIKGDIEAAMVALQTGVIEESQSWLPSAPTVDPAKCTTCLTCVRLCPHGAMSFQKRAEADSASCMRCGICAVECPMGAIKLAPIAGEADIPGKIKDGLALAHGTKKLVAFLCSRSAARAMESAGLKIRNNLTPIIVPCAGTVDPDHLLTAFREGADAVLVAGCHTGNCASLYGTILAGERSSQVRLFLEEAGIKAKRLVFTTVASNTPGDFVRAVLDLEANIGE
jgi:coenzyme F420-reducing hydrogenase delta subunit/Pyruvate/2-oxoacid:ferredoxin oxidoreductase delta subunit